MYSEKGSFPRFIILESLYETPLTKFSLSYIKKMISSKIKSQNVNNLRNGSILVEIDKKRQVEILLKMTAFHK